MNKNRYPSEQTEVYGVFEGGGVRGIALVGAISAIEKAGIQFRAVAGTSAGAIVAALYAVGYSAEEMYDILMDKDFKEFMDPVSSIPIHKWYAAYKHMGVYKGAEFRRWMNALLEEKLGIIQPRMEHLPKPLTIVATNLYRRRIDWFKGPRDVLNSQYLEIPIADAVRASMSIPGFFIPHNIADSTFIDGGILSNFPAFAFKEECKNNAVPVLGFRLDSVDPTKNITNTLDLITSLVDTIITHNSSDQLFESNTIRLSTLKIETTDFDISKEKKELLYEFARQATENWLLTHEIEFPSEFIVHKHEPEAVPKP